jgi:hypothetical protein
MDDETRSAFDTLFTSKQGLFLTGHVRTLWHSPYYFLFVYTFCNGHTRRSALSFYTTRLRFDRLAVYSFHRHSRPAAFTNFATSQFKTCHSSAWYWLRFRCRRQNDENFSATHPTIDGDSVALHSYHSLGHYVLW